jgi:hypothetical protein
MGMGGCTQVPVTAPAPASAPTSLVSPPRTPAPVSAPAAAPPPKTATIPKRAPTPKPATSSAPARAASATAVAPKTLAPPARSAPPAPAPSAPAPVAARPVAPALDLVSLEQRLRDTKAIGLFTKLSLKNQVDDLLARFRDFYDKKNNARLEDLRQKYDLLLLKVLSVLQDGDPALASAISASREAIWGILADPQKFSKLQT